MPELPEVETVVRGLKKTIIGKKIINVTVLDHRPLKNITAQKFKKFLQDQQVESVERFGKYIHIIFKSNKCIVSHLRMTGKYVYFPGTKLDEETKKHIRVIFHFSDKTLLLFKDLRIFGTIVTYDKDCLIEEKNKIGVEPLSKEFTAEHLLEQAKNRKLAVKQFLLDQKVVAGLGNIYVCEALFHAKINPEIAANKLTLEQANILIKKIQSVLKLAIKNNGTSVSDFRNVDDKSGTFQNMLKVYQKEGQLCSICKKGTILRIKQGQRSTFYCPVCQIKQI